MHISLTYAHQPLSNSFWQTAPSQCLYQKCTSVRKPTIVRFTLHEAQIFKPDVKNPQCQVGYTSQFCLVAPNICRSSVWNSFHVILPTPKICNGAQIFKKSVHPYFNRFSVQQMTTETKSSVTAGQPSFLS